MVRCGMFPSAGLDCPQVSGACRGPEVFILPRGLLPGCKSRVKFNVDHMPEV
jgi:hypothetical protein